MPSEIITYIRSNLSQGISPESIRSNLLNKGWKTEQIDQAFSEEINSLSEKNSRKSKNNKPSKIFFLSLIPRFLLGAVFAFGVLFIEIGRQFDVSTKRGNPVTTIFIEDFQSYLLPTVVFFIPSIFVFAKKFNPLKVTIVFLIVIISITTTISVLQATQTYKMEKDYLAKKKSQDDIGKYLSDNGVVHYDPGTSLGNSRLVDVGFSENKQGVKGWFQTQNGLLGNKLIRLRSFGYVSPGDEITCATYKSWPTVVEHKGQNNTCEGIVLIGKSAIYRYSDDKTVQFVMFDAGKTRLNIDIESSQINTPTKEEIINLVNTESKYWIY